LREAGLGGGAGLSGSDMVWPELPDFHRREGRRRPALFKEMREKRNRRLP
jgi:hypothetical protein